MKIEKWTLAEQIGYEPKTTFWQDFSIAESFNGGIEDTFKRAFKEWKKDYVYLTELAMVLNHKGFRYYNENRRLANLYFKYFEDVNEYAMVNLKDKELDYYLNTID